MSKIAILNLNVFNESEPLFYFQLRQQRSTSVSDQTMCVSHHNLDTSRVSWVTRPDVEQEPRHGSLSSRKDRGLTLRSWISMSMKMSRYHFYYVSLKQFLSQHDKKEIVSCIPIQFLRFAQPHLAWSGVSSCLIWLLILSTGIMYMSQ